MSSNDIEATAHHSTQDYYTTADLNLAAVLVTVGFSLMHLNKDNPRRVIFGFENKDGIADCADEYWSGKLKLPVQELVNQQKTLKQRIYSTEISPVPTQK